jgi:SAM-dependent methyltransferase
MDNETTAERRSEFERRGPWITRFRIDGEQYGGNFDAMNDARIDQFFELFPDAGNIIELGSLEGGHSFALAARPSVKSVVAIEARQENIDRSRFVQKLLGDQKVDFIQADIEKLDFDRFGKFDAVFCSGLLYHLPRPWELIPKLARISPNIFIWTQISEEEKAKKVRGGTRGKFYREGGLRDPLSGLSRKSFWMSLGSLMELLTTSGFRETKIIEHNLTPLKGHVVTKAI